MAASDPAREALAAVERWLAHTRTRDPRLDPEDREDPREVGYPPEMNELAAMDAAYAALPALRAALEEREGLWRCSCCGEPYALDGSWRETPSGPEHKCPNNDPQAGYFSARWFGPESPAAAYARGLDDAAKRENASLEYEVAMRAALERWIVKENGYNAQLAAWAYVDRETATERAAIRALSAGQPHAATAPSPGTSDPQVG
jgi:hypothetical protein